MTMIQDNLISLADISMENKFIGQVTYNGHTGGFIIIPHSEYPKIHIEGLGEIDLLREIDNVYVRTLNVPDCPPYMGYLYVRLVYEMNGGYCNAYCSFNGKEVVGFGENMDAAIMAARKITTYKYID